MIHWWFGKAMVPHVLIRTPISILPILSKYLPAADLNNNVKYFDEENKMITVYSKLITYILQTVILKLNNQMQKIIGL